MQDSSNFPWNHKDISSTLKSSENLAFHFKSAALTLLEAQSHLVEELCTAMYYHLIWPPAGGHNVVFWQLFLLLRRVFLKSNLDIALRRFMMLNRSVHEPNKEKAVVVRSESRERTCGSCALSQL